MVFILNEKKAAAGYGRGRTGSVYPFFRTRPTWFPPPTWVYPFCLLPQRGYPAFPSSTLCKWSNCGAITFAALSFLGFIVLPLHCSLRQSVSYHRSCDRTCLLSTYGLLQFVSFFVEMILGHWGHLEWKVTPPSPGHFVWVCPLGTPGVVDHSPIPPALGAKWKSAAFVLLYKVHTNVISLTRSCPPGFYSRLTSEEIWSAGFRPL